MQFSYKDDEETVKRLKISAFISFLIIIAIIVVIMLLIRNQDEMRNIYISEVCPMNNTVIADENGVYFDYIELFNPTDRTIDVEGYSLTDSDNGKKRYVFPVDSIKSNEHKLVWIDTGLTGFAISGGETIYLQDNTGKIIDRVGIPIMEADKVYKRSGDALSWSIGEPSEKVNITELAAFGSSRSADVSPPTASVKGGFYDEPFSLTLSSDEDCQIYFTLDGTMPTEKSNKYETPIEIYDRSNEPNVYSAIRGISVTEDYLPDYPVNKATVVRAIAVSPDGEISEECIETYFVDYKNKEGYHDLYTVSLITDPDNLFSDSSGIYVIGTFHDNLRNIKNYNIYKIPVNYSASGKGWRRKGFVQLYDPQGNYMSENGISFGIHGNYSVVRNQKSLNIITKDGHLFNDLFGYSSTSLILRAGGNNDVYVTKIRDILNQKLISDRFVRIQNAIPCQLFIDGEYWGVYNIQERIDKDFIANYYHVDRDNLILMKYKNVINGDKSDAEYFSDLIRFAQEHDMSDDSNYNKISEMMDIQSFIDYITFEAYVANSDSISNNFSVWRVKNIGDDKYYDGKWRWVIYDTDDSAGLEFENDPVGRLSAVDVDSFTGGNTGLTVIQDPLLCELINNDKFKGKFVNTFMDMANFNFQYDKVEKEIMDYANVMAKSVVESHKRFYRKDYTLEEYWDAIEKLKYFFANRFDYITDYLKEDFDLQGEKYILSIDMSDCTNGTAKLNTVELNRDMGTVKAQYYSDYPVTLSYNNSGDSTFVGWSVDGKLIRNTDTEILVDHNIDVNPVFERRMP